MKTRSLFFLIFLANLTQGQTYTLTVTNGYGGGQYAAGDTVQVWSAEWASNQTFSHWSGNISFLQRPKEWHTRLVMPSQNISIQANLKSLPPASSLIFEEFMGRDTLKRVYYWFPAGGAEKGVVWTFHGTGGSANSWTGTEYEQNQFVKYCQANGVGVIITESEESTKDVDLSGEGALRWSYIPDTVANVDIANVRAIRDTFIRRGYINWQTAHMAEGFSAGGAFAVSIASLLNWRAGISHCASAGDTLIAHSSTPTIFSMNLRDNHPDVGMTGNLKAIALYDTLIEHGVCAGLFFLRPAPLYPQAFKRFPGISDAVSTGIFSELAANNCLNAAGLLLDNPGQIKAKIQASPQNWPTVIALTLPQKAFFEDLLYVRYTWHHFHTDFMAADLAFLLNPCGLSSSLHYPEADEQDLRIYPNPVSDVFYSPARFSRIVIRDLQGRVVQSAENTGPEGLDVSRLMRGIYLIELHGADKSCVQKMIKI